MVFNRMTDRAATDSEIVEGSGTKVMTRLSMAKSVLALLLVNPERSN